MSFDMLVITAHEPHKVEEERWKKVKTKLKKILKKKERNHIFVPYVSSDQR